MRAVLILLEKEREKNRQAQCKAKALNLKLRARPVMDPTKLNARSSEVALAPRAAGRAQRRACGCALASRTRAGARRGRSRATASGGQRTPSPRRVATSVGHHPPASLEGGTDPWVYMLPLAGRGYDNPGGYIKSHKDGRQNPDTHHTCMPMTRRDTDTPIYLLP